MTASAYACARSPFCPACGAGLATPATACAAARCPGMNDARSANCSGHGVGADGGCRVVVSKQSRPSDAPGDDTGYSAQKSDDTEVSFVCECADGYEGEACETRVVGSVIGADAGVRAGEKRKQTAAAEMRMPTKARLPVLHRRAGGTFPRNRMDERRG